jgi:hypothetical protein
MIITFPKKEDKNTKLASESLDLPVPVGSVCIVGNRFSDHTAMAALFLDDTSK